MKLILLILLFFVNSFSVLIFSDDVIFFGDMIDSPLMQRIDMQDNVLNTKVQNYIHNNTASTNITVLQKSKIDISAEYQSSIFMSSYYTGFMGRFFYYVTYTNDDSEIISVVPFRYIGEIENLDHNDDLNRPLERFFDLFKFVRYYTMTVFSGSQIFHFDKNEISKYDVNTDGQISTPIELVVNNTSDFELIDNMFMPMEYLYLLLPFNIDADVGAVNDVITQLGSLKLFGLKYDNLYKINSFIYNIYSQTNAAGDQCPDLKYIFAGYESMESSLQSVDLECDQLESIFFESNDMYFLSRPQGTYDYDIYNSSFSDKIYPLTFF